MNQNFYFTYWIHRYSKEEFKTLINKVCTNMVIPTKILKKYSKDEYIFHYFFMLYCIIALNYFGLGNKEIALCLDFMIIPGISKAFPPSELLEKHQEVIPDILKYIKEDLELYSEKD